MFTEYNENELFELFENEPIIIAEKEAGMFIYTKIDNDEIKFTLSVSIYEKECSIFLSFKERLLFEATVTQVEYLQTIDKCLRIHSNKLPQDYLIYFNPRILIKSE